MDDMERRLKEMPLQRPRTELRQRIFDPPAVVQEVTPGNPWMRRIPIGWAAAAAALLCMAGFQAGRVSETGKRLSEIGGPARIVKVQIVEAPAQERNLFDFTDSGMIATPGEMRVTVRSGREG